MQCAIGVCKMALTKEQLKIQQPKMKELWDNEEDEDWERA